MLERLRHMLWLLCVLLVITGSLLPAGSPPMRAVEQLALNHALLHFCAYTSAALMALLALRRMSIAVAAALALIVLGVALEFVQKLVPGRGFEIRDIFINGFGVVTGIAIGLVTRRQPIRFA